MSHIFEIKQALVPIGTIETKNKNHVVFLKIKQ
jgi:hypothetical protein